MLSEIDPTKPTAAMSASKAELRGKLRSDQDEMETLQSGRADLGRHHPPLVTPAVNAISTSVLDLRDGGITWSGFPGVQGLS